MRVVVGGVGELYQGDLDIGRRAAGQLATGPLPATALVEDFSYGAVAVTQRLQELDCAALVLVGAVARGRPPGTVQRRRVRPPSLDLDAAQRAIGQAATGYVDLDLLVSVAAALGGLPERTVAVEVEPATTGPDVDLSPQGAAALEQALRLVRAEVDRAPLLGLADELRTLLSGRGLEASPALEALRALLDELAVLDERGEWGRTFSERDRLRLRISDGLTGAGMDHLDWSLWWALIEELDRLQASEVATQGRPGALSAAAREHVVQAVDQQVDAEDGEHDRGTREE